MALLNYDVLKKSGYDGYILEDAPVKVLQFGEGNFLRAFVDYWFDLANEKAGWNGKCCLVQPIAPGLSKMINEQEGLYTLYLRGSENGKKVDDKRVISSVANCLNPYEKADYDKMMEVAALSFEDRVLGAVFGFVRGIIVVAACVFLFGLSDKLSSSNMWQQSVMIGPTQTVIDWSMPYMPDWIQALRGQKIQGL